jgi:hypothetical protein
VFRRFSNGSSNGSINKPNRWTGWWLLKAVLIWFAGFLLWYPIFSKWPKSPIAKLVTVLFGFSMLPFLLGYLLGVLGDWVKLVGRIYALMMGSRDRR